MATSHGGGWWHLPSCRSTSDIAANIDSAGSGPFTRNVGKHRQKVLKIPHLVKAAEETGRYFDSRVARRSQYPARIADISAIFAGRPARQPRQDRGIAWQDQAAPAS
jgi:hypothetical protein